MDGFRAVPDEGNIGVRRVGRAVAGVGVHPNTVVYRLRRIRDVSGYDLSVPDTVFNLQLATRAWRTLQALHQS